MTLTAWTTALRRSVAFVHSWRSICSTRSLPSPGPTQLVVAQQVWTAWTVLARFLPYPDALVITTSAPDALAQVLVGGTDDPAHGLPGLRYEKSAGAPASTFLHMPTGAMLCLQCPTHSVDGAGWVVSQGRQFATCRSDAA